MYNWYHQHYQTSLSMSIRAHHQPEIGAKKKHRRDKQLLRQQWSSSFRDINGDAIVEGNNADIHGKCNNINSKTISDNKFSNKSHNRMESYNGKSSRYKKGQNGVNYECNIKNKRVNDTNRIMVETDLKLMNTGIVRKIASMSPTSSLISSAELPCESNSAVNQSNNNDNYFMRVQQSLMELVNCFGPQYRKIRFHNKQTSSSLSLSSSYFGGVCTFPLNPLIALTVLLLTIALPGVLCDDTDNFFAVNGFNVIPETTTPEFDYASRGQKKFGDKCENTLECGFPGSICDPKKKSCQCTEDLPVTNHIDKCGKEAAVNESCFFNEQCESRHFQTECRDSRCVCRFEMTPIWGKDGSVECKGRQDKKGTETYIDPAMIGVLVGMALMFIIICVVLRLFSQARWRENRTIFNTPNPRLMNVSLLRDSKLLHGQERRGSRMSVRGPSRQPSMVSLRPHSPNPSLGKTGSRTGSHGSNASGTSVRSARSNSVAPGHIAVNNHHHERKGSTYHREPHHHQEEKHHQQSHPHINQVSHSQPLEHTDGHHEQQPTSNSVSESVTVEIIEPEH